MYWNILTSYSQSKVTKTNKSNLDQIKHLKQTVFENKEIMIHKNRDTINRNKFTICLLSTSILIVISDLCIVVMFAEFNDSSLK